MALFTTAKVWDQPRLPATEAWIKKTCYTMKKWAQELKRELLKKRYK
jgi:hypothetical protein